jgi:hypothetical protein
MKIAFFWNLHMFYMDDHANPLTHTMYVDYSGALRLLIGSLIAVRMLHKRQKISSTS